MHSLTTAEVAEVDARLRSVFGEPRRRFPIWEQVRAAPVSQIAKAIRSSGLAQQKAPRIKQALQHITHERGRIELDFLKSMPVRESRRWLIRMTGVGPKT